ncbi:MAG: peptidoglycan editing factor PgeF [Actinomycetes bacterium]
MAQLLFTARHGGTSIGEFDSLNLANHVGDAPGAVEENRIILKSLLSQAHPIFMNQVHGNQVVEVFDNSLTPITADAIITRKLGLPLAVLSADCLPVLVKGESIVGVIHAGRKGILNGIISQTILKMRALGGVDLEATIGPAICGQCYEVDPQMYLDAISVEPNLATNVETHCLDLKKAAAAQLQIHNVSVADLEICTAHDLNFFSYRRDGISGRNVGVIVL